MPVKVMVAAGLLLALGNNNRGCDQPQLSEEQQTTARSFIIYEGLYGSRFGEDSELFHYANLSDGDVKGTLSIEDKLDFAQKAGITLTEEQLQARPFYFSSFYSSACWRALQNYRKEHRGIAYNSTHR